MNTTENQNDHKTPIATLVAAFINDPEYAWGWHCNIAMACYDKGARPHSACNAGAALFLKLLTDGKVDTTAHPAYQQTQHNAAPDPAGKLTDEQLGELAGDAVLKYASQNGIKSRINVNRSFEDEYYAAAGHREVFARAVRESVEKEQAEEITRLTAEVQSPNESYRVAGRVVREAQAELAKANAELERLRWRSVEVKPTREDADPEGFIEVMGKTDKRFLIPWYEVGLGKESLWRPFCPPPTPSAEEKSRTEFEAWIKQMFPGYALSKTDTGSYKDLNTRIAFAGWQAHASKEVK